MTMRMKWAGATVVALFVATLGAGNLSAQATTAESDEGDRIAHAEKLEGKAWKAAEHRDGFVTAVRLFREAAQLRGDQPESVEDLVMAGRLSYYLDREGDAIESLARAGEIALEWGDVLTAAESFLDAAWIAEQDGRKSAALELGRRAEKLSESPLIEGRQRASLRSRITDIPDGAV